MSKCINENINFEVLPGATAITTALVYSGLDTTRFLFRGFIPRENKERKILLNEIKDVKESIILYESPYRILNTLANNNLKTNKVIIDKENKEKWENLNIREHILSVMESGVTKKEAIKYVAKERGLSKNEVYKYAIDI